MKSVCMKGVYVERCICVGDAHVEGWWCNCVKIKEQVCMRMCACTGVMYGDYDQK